MLAGAAAGAAAIAAPSTAAPARSDAEPFGYSLNCATLRGHKLGIVKELEVAAQAGYGAIEPWIGTIRQYEKGGGAIADLKKRIDDLGLKIVGGVGFARWISDDDAQRKQGLEQMKSDMDLLAQIGGTGIAAPPAGMRKAMDLRVAAERYRAILEIGDKVGVLPQLEIWGPSPALSRPSQAVTVAMECGHPKASLLLDIYHIYKGGGSFAGLGMLGPKAMQVFHVNDYPADPPRETIRDSDRVFLGDGVAPKNEILQTLRDIGFRGWLSLELFNREYYKLPALDVA
ncbi:sugar phosphate isomerase/epimerase, partial [bacterium]|nr:sugar phosphate isomerase/epimerase [bacterium]